MKYLLPMILMFGCVQSDELKEIIETEQSKSFYKLKFYNHYYVIYDRHGYRNSVLSMIHDPDCPCHKQGAVSATHEQAKGMNGPNKPKGN